MSRNRAEIYLHFVWTTWQREPWISGDIERNVYRCIEDQANTLHCTVIAVGGMSDHVHLAVRVPTNVDAARIAMQVKGVSSTMVRQTLHPQAPFRWQEGYGVFSFARNQRSRVTAYITNQKQRHASNKLWQAWEISTEEDKEYAE